jgi:hypothetical protein
VLLDVLRGRPEDGRIVPEQSESVVAALAEQRSDTTVVVIMVEVLRVGVSADGAPVALPRPQLGEFPTCHSVGSVEVAVAARGVVATLAPTAVARGGAGATREVVVGHSLLAAGAPPEAGRNPGVVSDLLAHVLPVFAVPTIVPVPVALEAVERQAVRERPVSAEGRDGQNPFARRTSLVHHSK